MKKTLPQNKKQIFSNFLEDNSVSAHHKSTDINILLNRVKFNQKKEIQKKFYFSAAVSTALILFVAVII